MAWGQDYVDHLLACTIPAALAPGNIPFVSSTLEVSFALVTEEARFESVRAHPTWQRLGEVCEAKLVAVDDLLPYGRTGGYGVSLTLALLRGFADLGPRMTDTHVFFLNSDFLLADGSYRAVVKAIEAGHRLIHAPSYAVVEEDVMPQLADRVDPRSGVLSVPHRELARLALAHRHPWVMAQTVNRPLFSMRRTTQFYWDVDEHTLLCRQMPFALVCVRPTRVVTTVETLWDFGIVSELCPGVEPCVLGDSDDYLMIELRERERHRAELAPGWPTAREIAADLSSFTTRDQRVLGRFDLTLHDAPLPAGVEAARARLASFVDAVYAGLAEPQPHRGHPYFAYHFLKAQASPAEGAVARSGAQRLGAALERVYRAMFGGLPDTRPWHPYHGTVVALTGGVRPVLAGAGKDVLFIGSGGGLVARVLEPMLARHRVVRASSPGAVLPEREGKTTTLPRARASMPAGGYDAVVCDVGPMQVLELERIAAALKPLVASSGAIALAHVSDGWVPRAVLNEGLIALAGTRAYGSMKLSCFGGLVDHLVTRLYELGWRVRGTGGVSGLIGFGLLVALALPLALVARALERPGGGIVAEPWRGFVLTCVNDRAVAEAPAAPAAVAGARF